MKLLILSSLGLLYLSLPNADSSGLNQCILTLQYLTQLQLQNIQDVQTRLKQQQTSAEQYKILLAQTVQTLNNPDVLAKIQKNPVQASQIITKAIEECQQLRLKRAELAKIRENFPEDELNQLC